MTKNKPINIVLPRLKEEKSIRQRHQTSTNHCAIDEQLARCNTEPLSSLLQDQSQKIIVHKINQSYVSQQKKDKHKSRQIFEKKIASNKQTISNRDLSNNKIQKYSSLTKQIEQRKSIKQLIDFFEQKNQELKGGHLNYLQNRNYQVISEHKNIIQEYQSIRREIHHYSKMKSKLRKSQLKTQGNQSPKMVRKIKASHLRNILKIKNAVTEDTSTQQPTEYPKEKRKVLFFKPTLHIETGLDLQKLKMKLSSAKITSIGGWRTDKFDTQYLS